VTLPDGAPTDTARTAADNAVALLHTVLAGKTGSEVRPGQEQMAREVAAAIATGDNLLLEAGTGVGKSLGYLVPVIAALAGPESPGPVIAATATKALQGQLVGKDLPFLAAAAAEQGITFTYGLLKGRSNYLCQARLAEIERPGGPPPELFTEPPTTTELDALSDWAAETVTGDRDDYGPGFSDNLWRGASMSAGECPGAVNCPFAAGCFAETARRNAATVDVLVVNTALYAAHLASGGYVLPDHTTTIFDEAHTLPDVVADAHTTSLTLTRILRILSRGTGIIPAATAGDIRDAAVSLDLDLTPMIGRTVRGTDPVLNTALTALRGPLGAARAAAGAHTPADDQARTRTAQVCSLLDSAVDDIDVLLDAGSDEAYTAWVEENGTRRSLMLAPVDVSHLLAATLYPETTVIATSATLTYAGSFADFAHRIGLTRPTPGLDQPPAARGVAVDSPFDYQRNGYLYIPAHLPEPRDPTFEAAAHAEITALATAAGGRTLALFTSHAASKAAAAHLRATTGLNVLAQGEAGRDQLLETFRSTPRSVLCATQSFWTGVDIPGDALTCVIINKIPFPRPDDPLIRARRLAAGRAGLSSFEAVDLPAAAKLLAQGVGRAIRTGTDRAVVAVLDKRLADKYDGKLLLSLPPMRRTRNHDNAVRALRALDQAAG
jgi:ATP-dependent DNA helicase DinG